MEENKEIKPKSEISDQVDDQINKDLSDNNDNIIPEEILESIPIEDRGRVVSIIKQSMFSGVMRRGNPISEKITGEHITKLIDKADNQDLRDREERSSERNYKLIIFIIGLFFLGFLIVFLKDDKELLYKIIIAIISFVGGFGFGKTTHKKEE